MSIAVKKKVELEAALRSQHDAKRIMRKRRMPRSGLMSPQAIGAWLALPPWYVCRTAWELGLDPFPGHPGQNALEYAIALIVYGGYSVPQVARLSGFGIPYIRMQMTKRGWHQQRLWSNKRDLIVSKALAKYKLRRRIPKTYDQEFLFPDGDGGDRGRRLRSVFARTGIAAFGDDEAEAAASDGAVHQPSDSDSGREGGGPDVGTGDGGTSTSEDS